MKILHLISSGGMYGAEAVILNLSQALNAQGHTSIVAAFANADLQLLDAAAAQSIAAYPIPCRGPLDRALPAAIRDLVQRTGADIVHAHGYKADVYAFLALRNAAVPLVSTCHTWYDNDRAVRLYGALDRLVLRRFAAVVAVSEDVRQRLLHAGVRPSRIRLIRNGIATAPFAAPRTPRPPGHPLTVGLVGRLAPEKGVDLFLRAAARILPTHPATRFIAAGDGPDRATLEALIKQSSLQEHASLPGRQDDMPAFYASLDLLVSASRQEGLPIALLEGMASGLPLVATAVGAVPTIVHDNQTGVLVPPEDIAALANAILSLLEDPPRRARLGAAAQSLIANDFSASRMATDYLSLYLDVAPQPSSPGEPA